MPPETSFVFILEGASPERLDKAICAFLESDESAGIPWTRSQVKLWIEGERIRVDGRVEKKAGTMVRPGSRVEGSVYFPPSTLTPYEFILDVVYEDECLVVINKPAGISMHPGAGEYEKTIANAFIAHCAPGGGLPFEGMRPGIVHRLDKDTTGLVVIAKTVQAHAALAGQFAAREAGRMYKALVLSTPRAKRPVDLADEGVIEAPIGRHATRRELFAVVEKGGKPARTRWKAVERMAYASLLEVKIDTGRTHQIRVHLTHAGSPVIGDRTYGDFSALPAAFKRLADAFGRQALHAAVLELTHPASGERMRFERDMPDDLAQLIARFRDGGS